MKLDVPFKLVGEIDTAITNNIFNIIEEDDYYVYDFRKNMIRVAKAYDNAADQDQYNSILLRHSSEYSNMTIRYMPMHGKYKSGVDEVLEVLSQYYSYREWVGFIARLKPGGVIVAHTDNKDNEFLSAIHRVHIPLKTNPDTFYIVDGKYLNMEVGKIYEIDNMRVHSVVNNAKQKEQERIHLVINLYPA